MERSSRRGTTRQAVGTCMIYTVTLNPAIDRELTIGDFVYDTVLRASNSNVDFGGKGFNVSRMLASLGEASVAVGFTGGKSGELIEQGLTALGIQTDFVWVDGETRTNVVIIDDEKYLKVNESGTPVSDDKVAELIHKVSSLAKAGDWWVLAGSLPPNVPKGIYAVLINLIQSAGAHVILDTSGEALGLGCAANPYLVKPNDAELFALTQEKDIEAGAKVLLGKGVEHVVVSLGKDGVRLLNDTHNVKVASPSIKEKNPIGAGDSMVGGLVYGLSQGLSVPDALRWGVACGAATAAKAGTSVGTKEEVDLLLAQVT